jgi:hypothetical protein
VISKSRPPLLDLVIWVFSSQRMIVRCGVASTLYLIFLHRLNPAMTPGGSSDIASLSRAMIR